MPIQSFFVDLDDTLYPPSCGIWAMIRERMTRYMADELHIPAEKINDLRRSYYETYGTTMRGLMANYQIDPEEYLAYVHDVPVEEVLHPDPELRQVLQSFPQRKVIFTNADDRHSRRVLAALRLDGCFEQIIDIHRIAPSCKPQPAAFHNALRIAGEDDPAACLFLDDSTRNIATAREIGFATILVGLGEPNPAAQFAISTLKDLPAVFPHLCEELEKR